jgi:hypothetical protein
MAALRFCPFVSHGRQYRTIDVSSFRDSVPMAMFERRVACIMYGTTIVLWVKSWHRRKSERSISANMWVTDRATRRWPIEFRDLEHNLMDSMAVPRMKIQLTEWSGLSGTSLQLLILSAMTFIAVTVA